MSQRNYYDIDDILTDAQKVPCAFESTVHGIGFIEGSSNADIKAGTHCQLPLWLAEVLAVSGRGNIEPAVQLEMPPALSHRVQNALKADPRTVELRSQATHFYALGERILTLFEDEELGDILNKTFKERTREIADLAQNPKGASGGESAAFLRGLDEQERLLFRTAHEDAKAIKQFMADRGIKS